jgi:hypothetical protein
MIEAAGFSATDLPIPDHTVTHTRKIATLLWIIGS